MKTITLVVLVSLSLGLLAACSSEKTTKRTTTTTTYAPPVPQPGTVIEKETTTRESD
jgi:uncharacterized lipoprotein